MIKENKSITITNNLIKDLAHKNIDFSLYLLQIITSLFSYCPSMEGAFLQPKGKLMAGLNFNTFCKRAFEALGIDSQIDLAAALDLNRSAITQAKKKGMVPDKWLLILFSAYGVSPDWMVTGKGPVFLKNKETGLTQPEYVAITKVKARLCAGDGSFETDEGVNNKYLFQSEWLKKKGQPERMVLMEVFGNSMEPELRPGDTVLVDCSQSSIIAGLIYAVGVEDTIMIKRIEKHPGKILLRSDNKEYEPVVIEGESTSSLRVIGRIIWTCRTL